MRTSAFQTILLAGILSAFLISGQVALAEPNLVSWWKFDEGSGTTAYDSAGSNNGIVTGATWTTEGRIGGALSFDGINDYVALSSFTVSTDNGTIALWFETSADFSANYGGMGYLISRDSQFFSYLTVAGNGTVPYSIYGETNTQDDYFVVIGGVSPIGVWNQIVVSFYNKTAKTYLNGVLIQTDPVTNSSLTLTRIGGRTNQFFNGKIDDVRIYNVALSAGEIEQIYQEGLKATSPNPVDGAMGVNPNVVLSWSSGKYADSHDVYFGTNYSDVNDANTTSPEYKGNFDVNSFDPCGLELLTTYYWRIDEVNDPNLWKGDVWSFETDGPEIGLSASQFQFTGFEGGANPVDQILGISNSGAGTLNWQVSESCGWLSVEPNNGSSTGEVDEVILSVDVDGLATGFYSCELTISDANATNSPRTVTVELFMLEAAPVMLNYDAEAYAHASGSGGDTDTRQVFSSNEIAQVQAEAGEVEAYPCPPSGLPAVYLQRSYTKVSVEGIYDSNGARLVSPLKGWGDWQWQSPCTGEGGSGTGGGSGSGHTSLTGTMVIGVFEGYPIGTGGLTLRVEAEILGNSPLAWDNWDWWIKIWDTDPNNPLALLNDGNTLANVDVSAGQILNIEFYHEAAKDGWPEAGLESTVEIDLNILPLADFDKDGDVDFTDYAILASQWLEAPGEPSADIAPPPDGDNIVDGLDLGVLADDWLTGATAPKEPDEPNLVSYWKFDEGSGTTAYDSMGNNNGTINGATWTSGQIGGALHFDGLIANDYVSVPDNDNSLDMDNEMTIAAWVKPNDNEDMYCIVSKSTEFASNYTFAINVGLLMLYHDPDASWYDSTSYVTAGVWQHVAVTLKEGDSVKFYINGAPAGTLSQTEPFDAVNNGPVLIGQWNGVLLFYGDIDDVRIYNRELTAEEIEQLYQAGL